MALKKSKNSSSKPPQTEERKSRSHTIYKGVGHCVPKGVQNMAKKTVNREYKIHSVL
ncbi:MAG: hypothetical protein ACSW73_00275 [Spirochaetales bacterium]